MFKPWHGRSTKTLALLNITHPSFYNQPKDFFFLVSVIGSLNCEQMVKLLLLVTLKSTQRKTKTEREAGRDRKCSWCLRYLSTIVAAEAEQRVGSVVQVWAPSLKSEVAGSIPVTPASFHSSKTCRLRRSAALQFLWVAIVISLCWSRHERANGAGCDPVFTAEQSEENFLFKYIQESSTE